MEHERVLFLLVTGMFVVGFLLGMVTDDATVIMYPTDSITEKVVILPAVDSTGKGVPVPLEVEVKHGDGKVLTDIDKLLFWTDTQQSIQTARNVASNVTGIDTGSFDLIYTINVNQTGVVGGPSAGGSLTVATVAALLNQTVKKGVVMTGTINEDGTIGSVGGVLEKAKAAKDIGATLILVPKGQSTEINSIPKETCKEIFGFIYCETKYTKEVKYIADEAGIEVIEVGNIQEALNYFLE